MPRQHAPSSAGRISKDTHRKCRPMRPFASSGLGRGLAFIPGSGFQGPVTIWCGNAGRQRGAGRSPRRGGLAQGTGQEGRDGKKEGTPMRCPFAYPAHAMPSSADERVRTGQNHLFPQDSIVRAGAKFTGSQGGARGGTRTPTPRRWILNPVRLPIPPLSHASAVVMHSGAVCKGRGTTWPPEEARPWPAPRPRPAPGSGSWAPCRARRSRTRHPPRPDRDAPKGPCACPTPGSFPPAP